MLLAGYLNELEQSIDISKLPIVHNTNSDHFFKILNEGKLLPQMCDVFSKDLVYFFYGRPAYKLNTPDNFPPSLVGLVLDYSMVDSIYKIFPFDSGAFDKGFYSPYIENLEDFCLLENLINTHIQFFFKNNFKYLKGEIFNRDNIENKYADKFYNLAKNANEKCDDRRLTIEISNYKEVKLLTDTLKAIILPNYLLEDDSVINFLDNLDPEVITYSSFNEGNPCGFNNDIYNEYIDIFGI